MIHFKQSIFLLFSLALIGLSFISCQHVNNIEAAVLSSKAHSINNQAINGSNHVDENSSIDKLTITEMTFGSNKILEGCWTPEELAGSERDKHTIRPWYDAHRSDPPARITPINSPPDLPDGFQGSIRRVVLPADKKYIALTFDLCERIEERAGYDARVINYLRARQIKATFFAGGKWMRSHPVQTKQLMADPLFEIGNHSWSHGNFHLLSEKEMEEQIQWSQAQYELLWEELQTSPCALNAGKDEMNKIPRIPVLFRFPYGTCGKESLSLAAQYGLSSIQWDVVSGDASKFIPAQTIASVILQKTRPGSIIICHANGHGVHTAEALPMFIPQLLKNGYRFVTVSELLSMGRPFASDKCYENRPGDNYRYDAISGAVPSASPGPGMK